MKKLFSLFVLCALVVLMAESAQAARKPASTPNTVTGWCLDLNRLLHVDVPVIVGRPYLIPFDPTICTPSGFPIQVPTGSEFVAGGVLNWYTNKEYSPLLRQALADAGYNFKSNSPHQDFFAKIDEVRVDVSNPVTLEVLATFTFDPRKNFRLLQVRDLFYGPMAPTDPVDLEAFNIHLTVEEFSRLPQYMFPAEVGPLSLAPGRYRVDVWWHLTETHNDGLSMDVTSFLPAGWNWFGANTFAVTP